MTTPEPESLRMLYTADVVHIAQMKERQWSAMKWTVGLGVTNFLVFLTKATLPEELKIKLPNELLGAYAIFVIVVAVLCSWIIFHTQRSMCGKRKRLWKVYDDLGLDKEIIGKTKIDHTNMLYGATVWVPMLLACLLVAGVTLRLGWSHMGVFFSG